MKNPSPQTPANDKSPLTELVAMSRRIGADPALVLGGGGNTSLKVIERDFRGLDTRVLRVKASGSDLKAIEPRHFAGVRLDDVLPLEARADMSDEEMVDYLTRTLLDPGDPRPSIETLLHAFLPFAAVAHSHADVILALSNNAKGIDHIRSAFGGAVATVLYLRPGFLLAKEVAQAVRNHTEPRAVVLMNHGLVTWGDSCAIAYERHVAIVREAQAYLDERRAGRLFLPADAAPGRSQRRAIAARLAPALRGALKGDAALAPILRCDDGSDILAFLNLPNAEDLSRIGAATPDHILSTKVRPLFISVSQRDGEDAIVAAMKRSLDAWRAEYAAYYERNRAAIVAPMLEANPRVALAPGIGMFTTGNDLKSAQVAADVYHHTLSILDGAGALGGYATLAERDAALAEYWPLELYKLTLAQPERELSRKIALITGAGSGIGRAIAELFAAEGAHIAVCDIDEIGALETANAIEARHGFGRAIALTVDVASEAAVRDAFEKTALAFGGLDILVSNAGIAPTGRIEDLSLETWERSMAVNATGHFLAAREAVGMMRAQAVGGAIVFNVTKNVPAPGADFGAYSCAKAAEAQLCRILAVENGRFGIRCNMLNPDAVFEAGLWTEELKAERARAQGITPGEVEDFYRKRSLLQLPVHARDVAQAALFFASEARSAKTTGAMLPVDGGLREAFPR